MVSGGRGRTGVDTHTHTLTVSNDIELSPPPLGSIATNSTRVSGCTGNRRAMKSVTARPGNTTSASSVFNPMLSLSNMPFCVL